MNAPFPTPPQVAQEPSTADAFLRDALEGLGRKQKTLPAKYFYDLAGSRLFEDITRLDEYYPTRTELRILRDHAADIASLWPAGAAIVEFGAGSNEKVRVLLGARPDIAAYVPIDVSGEFVRGEADQLSADLPEIEVFPVVADFTHDVVLPRAISGRPRVGFFPGSTIGNFEPDDARDLLERFAELLGRDALLIVGVDLDKDDATLEAAYDDRAGTTGRFNLNLLARLNRELGADFDLSAFEHRAFFNRELSRIEMHLVSARRQSVTVAGRIFDFAPGETIHTESSYKYTLAAFEALSRGAGWSVVRAFPDRERLFSIFVMRAS